MRTVISRSLMPERSANESTAPLHSFANSHTIITLGRVFLSSLVSPFVVAQVTPSGKVKSPRKQWTSTFARSDRS